MAKAPTAEPALIPREVLFGNPERASPRLSPDGTRLAYLAPVAGVLNVWAGPVDGSGFAPITDDRERGIRIFFWAYDNRHILYLQDAGGNENWRLYAVDLETGATRDLTPFPEVQTQVVAMEKSLPNDLLIALNKDNPEVHDVYHLNLALGELARVAQNPGTYLDWVADKALQVRGALAATPDGGSQLLVRDEESADWAPLVAWDADDSLMSGPIAFTGDGKALLVRDSTNANATRLVRLYTGSGARRILAEDPEYDVADLVIHPDTHEVQMVAFNRARKEWTVLDETIVADVKVIEELARGDFEIVSRDSADRTWLVAFVADNAPTSYYVYSREARQGEFLFDVQPALAAYQLAEMEPISFVARDGLTVHGYLTFPPGAERTNLPLVLNVHGGPNARDTWGYDPEAQWLANRGYCCLQVNYRGSTGYGKRFLNAGDREWGGKMQDDLTDAVGWAVGQGYADPTRVAIFGGSYGGYAALAGAAFTPDVYRCAVDIVGPSNIATLLRSIPSYWSAALAMMYRRIGNPDTEEAFLHSRSPLFKADQIRIPILIAQGANDPRVKQAEAEQIVAALEANGVEHTYMLFPDEGHGFAKPENRLTFFAAAEAFLAKHLGGRHEKAKKA